MQNSLDDIAKAFDAEASVYGRKYADNPVMAELRRIFRREALASFPRGGRLMDLGCGTGEETLFFADEGFSVLAADPSEEMLEAVRSRARGKAVETLRVSTREPALLPPGAFDGVLAFWGPLNYDEDPGPAFVAVRRALRPGGRFVFTSVNRFCLWETLHALARGRARFAFRRRSRSGVEVPVGDGTLTAFCPSAGRIRAAAKGLFRVRRWRGLGVALPPPHLAGAVGDGLRLKAARFLEGRLAALPFLRLLGDHLLFILEAL